MSDHSRASPSNLLARVRARACLPQSLRFETVIASGAPARQSICLASGGGSIASLRSQ
jgi:hypothetical protein